MATHNVTYITQSGRNFIILGSSNTKKDETKKEPVKKNKVKNETKS
jgi:hypothetical protein